MTSSRPVDGERAAVYAAELAAFDGTDLEVDIGFAAVAARTEAVVADTWWPRGAVRVQRAKSTATSSSTRCVGAGSVASHVRIRFAAGQCTVATAAHELAHVVAGPEQGHGATFRAAYLDVVAVITNLDPTDRRRELHVEHLRDAFAAAGLHVGDRSWPAPPPGVTGSIAL